MDLISVRKELGRRVRKARKAKGLSQEKLARRSGIARGYLVEVEAGRSNLALPRLVSLATSLKVSLEDLFRNL